MKKISEREYKADSGKVIVSKINKLKYKHIKLSNNDSIKNYEEVSDISSDSPKPAQPETSKKWSLKND